MAPIKPGFNVQVDKKDAPWIIGTSMGADALNSIVNGSVEAYKTVRGFDFLTEKLGNDKILMEKQFTLSMKALNTKEILADIQKEIIKYVSDKKTEVAKHSDNTKLAMHRLTEYYKTQRAQALALNKAFSARSPYYYGNVA